MLSVSDFLLGGRLEEGCVHSQQPEEYYLVLICVNGEQACLKCNHYRCNIGQEHRAKVVNLLQGHLMLLQICP